MEDQPLFSVIIPTYNRAALLKIAIQSVIDQTFQDWEIVVVDDGSTDHTKEIVKSFDLTSIKYVFQKNQKLSAARNTGVKHSSGKYICFLDDDDYLLNDHLINFANYLTQHNYPITILRSAFSYKTRKGIRKGAYYDEKIHKNAVNFAAYNFCGSVSLCTPRVCFEDDLFLPGMEPWEDTHFMLRIFAKYPLVQLPHYTYIYVKHSIMGSIKLYTQQDTLKMAEQNVNAMRHFFDHYSALVESYLPSKTRSFIISEKYSQHAFNAVLFGKYAIGWKLFRQALKEDRGFYQWKMYLKFLVLLPIKFTTGFPRIKFIDQ